MQILGQLKIRHKLFGAYAGITLVILMLSFSFLYFQVRKGITQQLKEELAESNQIITDMVETAVNVSIKNYLKAVAERNRDIVTYFYQQYQAAALTEAEAMNRAKQALMSQRIGKSGYIYCINSQGILTMHPQISIQGNNISSFQFIDTQKKKKTGYLEYAWKNPEESRTRPKALYMTYFKPWDLIISATSYKSEFSHLVSSDDFKDNILKLTFGKTGYAFITDTAGNMVIHPDLSEPTHQNHHWEPQAIIHEMIKKKHGFLTYFWKNSSEHEYREKLAAFNTINAINWIVASSSYSQEVFAPLDKIAKYFLIILAMALLITGLVTLGVSNYITTPLISLITQLERSTNEKSFFRIKSTRNDEIGKLSNSLNLFMNQLEEYQRDIVKENRVRKKAEKEIRILQNYLANIINSMPSVLIGINREFKVIFWNKQAEKRTGIPVANAKGRYLYEAYPRLGLNIKKLGEMMEKNESQYFSKRPGVLPDTGTSFADIVVYPLFADEIKGVVIRIDDVTERVQMEEMLIQNDKILSLGGLAAGMAHEINNPLAGMIQNANVLSNRLTNPAMPANIQAAQEVGISMEKVSTFMLSRKIPGMIKAILDSGLRISNIVENMLSFARKGDTNYSPHDPVELLDKTLMLASTDFNFRKQYDFKSIKIKKRYEDKLPMLFCDSSKIQQVILNILHNGAHNMFEAPSGLEPRFTLRLYLDKDSGTLCMEIEDNGSGMDKETQKKIFEPFFTTKPAGHGTGLGLSVAYFIITKTHGGTLDVVTEKGKGTNFIIRLPLWKQPIAQPGEVIVAGSRSGIPGQQKSPE